MKISGKPHEWLYTIIFGSLIILPYFLLSTGWSIGYLFLNTIICFRLIEEFIDIDEDDLKPYDILSHLNLLLILVILYFVISNIIDNYNDKYCDDIFTRFNRWFNNLFGRSED